MSRKYFDQLLTGTGVSNRAVKSAFGEAMLKKMGWKQGEGLGKDGAGKVEVVQIKRREESMGLGADQEKNKFRWDNQWWGDAYNKAASQLAVVQANHDSSSSDSSDSESDDQNLTPDQLLLKACEGRTCRKGDMMQGKLKRIEEQDRKSIKSTKNTESGSESDSRKKEKKQKKEKKEKKDKKDKKDKKRKSKHVDIEVEEQTVVVMEDDESKKSKKHKRKAEAEVPSISESDEERKRRKKAKKEKRRQKESSE